MKKVYDFEQFFFIEGQTKEFHSTSIWRHLRLLSDDDVVKMEGRWQFPTFQDLWEYVEAGNIWNAEAQKTLFGKRQVYFKSGIDGFTVREKNYKPVTLWHHCTHEPSLTMKTLMEEMRADDFCEYLRERGISFEGK